MCNCPQNTPNPCNDCPPIITPNPDQGCLQPIVSSCVTYDGEGSLCANISSGQSLNQVIEQLANNDCDLQEQIEDIVQDIEELSGNVTDIKNQINNINSFSCEDLSGCTLDELGDVDVTHVSGDILMSNGTKWINYTPEEIVPYQFTCEELSGCTLDSLSGVSLDSPTSGDVLIHDGNNFINYSFADLFTADNGLTKNNTNIQLGGALTKNTSFSGNYDFYFGNKNYIFGDDNSFIGSTGVKFVHKLTKSLNALPLGFSTNFRNSVFTIDTGFNLSAGQGLFNDNSLTTLNINNSKSILYSSKAANQASYMQIRGTGTPTLTMSPLNGNIGTLSNHLCFTQLDNLTDNPANKAIITHYANYESLIIAQNTNHNAITNFYHLFLADTTNNLPSPSYLTNKYGIYQEGASDKNVFYGEIEYHGALINASDLRSKNKGEAFTKGLAEIEQINPTNFTKKEGFGKTDVNHVGIIAQEIENIIPEAIKIGNCKDIEDFRFYDQSVLIYTLINAVKELKIQVDSNKEQYNSLLKIVENQNEEINLLKEQIENMNK